MVSTSALVCLLSISTLCISQMASASTAAQATSDKLVAAINKKDYDKFVVELTAESVDTNQPDSKGHLPMVEAARTRDIRFVDSLLQYGAYVRVSDVNTGSTPLHSAIQTGALDIVKLLLSYGASPDTADKSGKQPRQLVGQARGLRELLEAFDQRGAAAFEDAPGTWTKVKKDKSEDEYWYNPKTSEARWNSPPSCAWQRVDVQGQPAKYVNAVTGQYTNRIPVALAWRHVHMNGGADVWFNWLANFTQYEAPHEVPQTLLKELKEEKNVRWYNERTQQFSWEDPKHHTLWRVIQEAGAEKPYYYNIETAQSQWEVPEEMAWTKMESDKHPGSSYFWNSKTGESTWEKPAHMSWARQDTDV